MIVSFDIRVPSVVETEGVFQVEVRALDVDGKVLVSDSTTVVQVIPSDPNIEFDANENGIFGEVGDDTKTLTNGIAIFPAKDTKSGTFTIDVTDTQANTGLREFSYSFNCLVLPSALTDPPEGVSTLNSRQFFAVRDQVDPFLPDAAGNEIFTSQAASFTELETLRVFREETLDFDSRNIAQGDGTTVETLPLGGGTTLPTQSVAASRATFNTNEIKGNPVLTFDGNDSYDLENEGLGGVFLPESDFTILAGVRLLQSGGVQTIFAQYEEAVDNGKLVCRYDNGFELAIGSDGVLPALSVKTPSQATNTAHFVLFERRNDVYRIEVDGTALASVSDGGTRQVLQTGNVIGARSSSGAYNDSLTDFYPSDLFLLETVSGALEAGDKALKRYDFEDAYGDPVVVATSYVQTISSTYTPDLLVSHDDTGATGIIRDYSGNGFNLEPVVLPTPQQVALNTDGGSSYLYQSEAYSFIPGFTMPVSAGRSFHFWVNVPGAVDPGGLDKYLFDHASPRTIMFWELGAGTGFGGEIGIFDTTFRSFGVSLPRASTVLLSYIFSGATCELYLDGISQGSIAARSVSGLTPSTTSFGANIAGDFAGGAINVDTMFVSNVAHDAAQVLAIYTAGVS